MFKNVLKFCFIGLLLLSIVAVPLFGFYLYDSPSVLKENALFTNLQFGGGTSVYLSFSADEGGNVTAEDYPIAADIIKERFLAIGYSDIKTSVEDDLIRVDIAQKTFVDSTFSSVATIGEWNVVGSSYETLCDSSMVEDAYIGTDSNGYIGVTIDFTEDGAAEFTKNVASYAVSGAGIYLIVDGQYKAYATVSSSVVKDTFTFTGYSSYDQAAADAAIIKHGSLPATLHIEKTEELAASLSSKVILGICAGVALVFAALCVILLIKGRSAGIFGICALIADIAVWATAIANGSFMLNVATLFAMVICLILMAVFYIYTVAPLGKTLKIKKSLDTATLKVMSKASLKCIWTHALVFAISLTCFFFVKGVYLYVAKAVLFGACASFASFFIFIYFGVHTLADALSEK